MEACLCVAYFESQSGYSKSFEQPCINTSVKRLCTSERCNEKVTCFLMSHASCKSLEFSFPLLLFPFTDFYGRFDSLSPILRDSSCLLWAFSFKFCAVNRRAAGYNWSTRAWPTFDRCVHCIQYNFMNFTEFFFSKILSAKITGECEDKSRSCDVFAKQSEYCKRRKMREICPQSCNYCGE